MTVELGFEWDPDKADKNVEKHQVSFKETTTVFDDPMFITFIDDEHSIDEERYVTIGLSGHGRLLMVAHADRQNCVRIINARRATKRNSFMPKPTDPDDYELRDEYDLSTMTVAPKGRYAPHRRAGENGVLLSEDVVKAFPTDEAVNEALRLVMRISEVPAKYSTEPADS